MLYYINEKKSYNGETYNDYPKSVKKAISFLFNSNIFNFNLAVHTKAPLSGILSDVLGDNVCKQLTNKKLFQHDKGTIGLITEKIAPIHQYDIIACFISYGYLKKLIRSYPNVNIIYIPWTEEEEREISTNRDFTKL